MTPHLLHGFDRIAIIHLPHRRDRRLAVTHELHREGIAVDGERVRFVDGVRASDAGGLPSRGARGASLRLLLAPDDVTFAAETACATGLRRVKNSLRRVAGAD